MARRASTMILLCFSILALCADGRRVHSDGLLSTETQVESSDNDSFGVQSGDHPQCPSIVPQHCVWGAFLGNVPVCHACHSGCQSLGLCQLVRVVPAAPTAAELSNLPPAAPVIAPSQGDYSQIDFGDCQPEAAALKDPALGDIPALGTATGRKLVMRGLQLILTQGSLGDVCAPDAVTELYRKEQDANMCLNGDVTAETKQQEMSEFERSFDERYMSKEDFAAEKDAWKSEMDEASAIVEGIAPPDRRRIVEKVLEAYSSRGKRAAGKDRRFSVVHRLKVVWMNMHIRLKYQDEARSAC